MFHLFGYIIPILIIVFIYYRNKPVLNNFYNYLNIVYKTLPYLVVYALILYYLEMENWIDADYAFLTFITFFIPVIVMVLILKLIYWIKRKKQ